MSDRIRLDAEPRPTPEPPPEPPQEPVAQPEPAAAPADEPAAPEGDPAPAAGEPAPAVDAAAQLRIDRLTREKFEAQRQRDEYASLLRAQQQPQYQQPQYQQPADPIEQARLQGRQEAEQGALAQRFNEACNGLFVAGQSEYGAEEMRDAVAALNAVGYGNRPDALAALTRLPDGHRVYRELAGNLENAARILSLEPMHMAMEFARMSRGEAAPAAGAAPSVPVSRAPPPPRPVGGNAARAPKPLDKMSMAEFIRERDRTERRSKIMR